MTEDIYLDNAATTPVREEVLEVLNDVIRSTFGNASSIHTFGQEAKRILESSRQKVASLIGASPEEVVFTSGGTESDNLAIRGTALAMREKGNHIITTAIEHPAVLNCCGELEREGFEVSYLPVDSDCRLHLERLQEEIRPDTILISVMYANNETGAIQPIHEIGNIAAEKGIVFHTDAVQAAGKVAINTEQLGASLLSISGHKIYGPKGIGALYIRRGTPVHPILFGGHHENNFRPGTENVPGIAAFTKALELAVGELASAAAHLENLKEKLANGLEERIEGVGHNGCFACSLPNILNMSFGGVDGEAMLLNLDMKGIAVSTGSACSSGATDPSHVLLAMGVEPMLAQSSLRFSFGRNNTVEEIDEVLRVLPDIVIRLREMSAVKFTPDK